MSTPDWFEMKWRYHSSKGIHATTLPLENVLSPGNITLESRCDAITVRRQGEVVGLSIPDDRGPSTALGNFTANPLELAGAYGALASGGTYCKPYLIRLVKDANGATMYKHVHKGERVATRCEVPTLSTSIRIHLLCVLQRTFLAHVLALFRFVIGEYIAYSSASYASA
jgi:hypothetical protein